MMNIGDPRQLAYLRDLPSGYLLDLLADSEGVDEASIRWVLQERCYTPEEIEQKVNRRKNSRIPRRPTLWRMARWISFVNAGLVAVFNLRGAQHLIEAEALFHLPLLFLLVSCTGFGFFLGYKMTTHVYQGEASRLLCGFPLPVGFVDLETGEETTFESSRLITCMAVNAAVSVNLTIFPVFLIHHLMS